MLTVKRIVSKWDHASKILAFAVTLSDGRVYAIGLPLIQIRADFERNAAGMGATIELQTGELESVDGLFKFLKRAGRTLKRAYKKTISKAVKAVGKAAVAVARSKALGAALGAAAVVCPAVGAPALAAWATAHQAVNAYDRGKRTVAQGARLLQQSKHPRHQLVVAAMKSIR